MSNRNGLDFAERIRIYGFCCPFLFFKLNAKLRTGVLASLLGYERRTIQRHRHAFLKGSLASCPLCPSDSETLSLFVREAADTSSPLQGPFRKLPVFRGKT